MSDWPSTEGANRASRDEADEQGALRRLRVRIVEGPDRDLVMEGSGDVRTSEAVVTIGTQIRIGRTVVALLDAAAETPSAQPARNLTVVPQYRVARAEAVAAFERNYLPPSIEATGGNALPPWRVPPQMDRPTFSHSCAVTACAERGYALSASSATHQNPTFFSK